MKSTKGEYYNKLDHLRFLAALLVMFWHGMHFKDQIPTSSVPNFPLFSILEEGHTGVALFMVLSGYIFWQLCRNKEISYIGFLRNRLLRIVPLLIVYLLTLKAVSIFGPEVSDVSWTIKVEFQFYIIFPLILLTLRKYGFRYVFGLLFLALVFRYALWLDRGYIQDLAYWKILGRIDQFLMGILACELVSKQIDLKLKVLCGLTFVTLLAAFNEFNELGGFYHMPVYPSKSGLWIIIPTLEGLMWANLIVLYLSVNFSLPSGVNKTIAWFGVVSFSIYLNHMFIIELVYTLESKLKLLPTGIWNICLNIIFITLPITLLLSSFTYLIIEKPFLSLRKSYII